MESVPCNLCGHLGSTDYDTIPDLLLERIEIKSTLVKCNQCGLIYQNPRPTLTEMGQHYPPEYEPYADNSQEEKKNSWLLQKAIDYGINKRCRFVTKHKQEGALLDVGCAAGTFLLGMRRQGQWDVAGVEINRDVAQLTHERHHLDIFPGTLEEATYPSDTFDAVTLWDVFEHLHDPAAGLREIHRILKPNGIVVIRVPNLASWDAQLFGPYWAGLDAPRHLYIFTPDTLSQMLSQMGFEVVEHSCAIGSYMTFVLSIRFWLSAKQVSDSWKQTASKILYHPVARLVSAPFFYLPNLTLRGPLLVTTARKVVSSEQ